MRLLHIDASPRGIRSRSRAVAHAFVEALGERYADFSIEQLDLWEVQLPELGGEMIEGRYDLIMGNPVEPAIAAAWDEVGKVAEAFLDCDAYLVSTPTWNFGLPYRLKHYVDVVTQPGMTFRNDEHGNVEGLAAGRKALLIGSSALPIGIDGQMANLDFQLAYLDAWLRFVGVNEIETVRVAPTFGSPADVEAVMKRATGEAQALAGRF